MGKMKLSEQDIIDALGVCGTVEEPDCSICPVGRDSGEDGQVWCSTGLMEAARELILRQRDLIRERTDNWCRATRLLAGNAKATDHDFLKSTDAQKRVKLAQMILDNPEKEVVCMVEDDVACDAGYDWYQAKIGDAYQGRYCNVGNELFDDESDLEEAISESLMLDERYEGMTDEEMDRKVQEALAGVKWTECIFVNIVTAG